MDQPYTPLHTLKGYDNTINALAFSPNGEFLATGGEDGMIKIWNPQGGESIANIQVKSPILCLEWDPKRQKRLFFGCQNGTAAFVDDFGESDAYPIQTGIEGGQVYALAVDNRAHYVGISIGPEIHIAHLLVSNGSYATLSILPGPRPLPNVGAKVDQRVRGRALRFIKNSSRLIVSYLNHGVVCWDIDTSLELWRVVPSHESQHIGSSMLSPDGRSILVSNLSSGMNTYSLDTLRVTGTYQYTINARTNFPLSVAYLRQGRFVTCGTHTGVIDIWDTKSGEVFQSLNHDCHLVTCLATKFSNGYEYVATATTGNHPVVKIWRNYTRPTLSEAITEIFCQWKTRMVEIYDERNSRNLIIGAIIAIGTFLFTRYLLQPVHVDPAMEARFTTWMPYVLDLFGFCLEAVLKFWGYICQSLRRSLLEWLDVKPHEVHPVAEIIVL